ncbi:MAG: heme lyase CcmF/NrfE family subunit [Acidobacteria bacterium]|nr:heme lyase CcmF/NrfE family subunit [Acidobacteriota bacterium]MCI0623473.1 heme lyase CcmF/NrfE family subunit [Acidobacteriota bacterium]MCI0723993.1 heme lyase CcmF/NrfE family subunit [Acidobacteriota bacterium]
MLALVSDFGQFCLLFAFCLSSYAVVSSFLGGKMGNRRLVETAERAVIAVCALVTLTVCTLWYQLLNDNFNLQYVASNSNRAMPWYYKFGALWGGQEGSLVFWCWILCLYCLATVLINRQKNRNLMPYVVCVISIVTTFFLLVNNFVANPFDMIGVIRAGSATATPFTPMDGNGLSALLQYWAMVIHPPILYTGYVGFTIPFAFAIAALITRDLDEEWIRTTRRWMMVPWLFQGCGVLLGAKWAYVVLGWGGYWGWDPVENASLMPWLAGTAFLHSVIMQERKGMMKVWNMVLILSTFLLCIFGTFLTRSGIVSSVHTFAVSPIGPYFSSFLFLMISLSAYLLLTRLDSLKSENRLDSVVSRESSFLFNNLILLASMFAVLWGTIFPIITEYLQNEKRTVSAPFYNKVNVPIGLFLLFLTGVGPLLAWRKTSMQSLKRNFTLPTLAALLTGAIFFSFGMRHFYSMMCLILCVFVMATILAEFHRGARARRRQGESYLEALWILTFRNTRRYGGYIVHMGMVFLFVGFAGAGFNQEIQKEMAPGESLEIGNYSLTLEQVKNADNANYASAVGILTVYQNGKLVDTLLPERRFYRAREEPTTEVALRSGLKEDLYVVLAGFNPSNTKAIVHVYLNPLVTWIWIGGLVFMLGTVVCLIPDRHEKALQKAAVPAGVEELVKA